MCELSLTKGTENEPGNPLSLSQKTVSALYLDNQNNFWIGTHRGGINFYAAIGVGPPSLARRH